MLSWTKESARDEPIRIVQDAIVEMIGTRAEGFTAALKKFWKIAFGSAKRAKMGKFSAVLRHLSWRPDLPAWEYGVRHR